MLIIGHFVIILIVGINGQQEQTKDVTELTHLVGVKVPNEKIQISSWIPDANGLIVEAQPNNEMYAGS
jgi:hypothetical protein